MALCLNHSGGSLTTNSKTVRVGRTWLLGVKSAGAPANVHPPAAWEGLGGGHERKRNVVLCLTW